MHQSFDYYNQYETPVFLLCNPDKQEMFSLGEIHDRKLNLRFNTLSTLEFIAPAQSTGSYSGSPLAYYNFLTYRRLIYVVDGDTSGSGIGYFMITEVEETSDGINREKKIKAQSLEYELALKKITLFKGTYKFYDLFYPETSLIGKILTYLPDWQVGYISTSLMSLYRTFDVSDSTIYNFLMNEVEQAYQCIFTFNTISKTINAYTTTEATTTSDIYLSYNNLLETTEIKELTDEMVTALNVYGKGDLDISMVNPLGNNTIYNFNYYKNTNWMTPQLIQEVTNWENEVTNSTGSYVSTLALLSGYNGTKVTLTSQLEILQGEYDALEAKRKACIEAGQLTGTLYQSISASLVRKQNEMISTSTYLNTINSQINTTTNRLTAISGSLSFNNNFSASQIKILSAYIIGNTYNNTNFVQTDSMSASAIQAEAQLLYNQAVIVLNKVSQPRYEFSVDTTNFLFLKEFQSFITQLKLGTVVTLELQDGTLTYPVLLGIDLNYDDGKEFNLLFGNRLRLDNSGFEFSDLYNQIDQANLNTSFNSEQWSTFPNSYQDRVSVFIDSALNASLNNLISSTNQEIKINQNGLKGRKYSGSSTSTGSLVYGPEEVWLTSNTLAFTKNNWQTASLAIGKIVTTGSNTAYGVVGDVIVGRILAGNQLTITNESSTFTVDGAHATLSNADFSITKNHSRILLNPLDGIKIQGNPTGSWKDYFYADSGGNLIMEGNFYSGTNYILTNGNAKIGALTIQGNSATFTGTIYATKLSGYLDWSQITNAPLPSDRFNGGTGYSADGITSGYLSGNRIYGGVITWPHGRIGNSSTGAPELVTDTNMTIYSSATLGLSASQGVGIYSQGDIAISTGGTLYINGVPYATGGGATQSWCYGEFYTKGQSNAYYVTYGYASTYLQAKITGYNSYGGYPVYETGGISYWTITNGIITGISYTPY